MQISKKRFGEKEVDPPQVFLSYRHADWGGGETDPDRRPLIELTNRLKTDLGKPLVFRDKVDLLAGQRWAEVIDVVMKTSDAILILIGPKWTGTQDDGERRIDTKDDFVRQEVVFALDESTRPNPVPVLIDLAKRPEFPEELESMNSQKFHWAEVSRSELLHDASVDYQRILAAIWAVQLDRFPQGILVVGDYVAQADLDRFVTALRTEAPSRARLLSQVGAGTFVISADFLVQSGDEIPDVIVLIEEGQQERNPERRGALLKALAEHPRFNSIAIIGSGAAGVAATLGAVSAIGGQSTVGTVASSHADGTAFLQMAESGSHTGTGAAFGAASTKAGTIGGLGAGAKIAAAAAAILLVAGAAVAVGGGDDSSGVDFANRTTIAVADGIDERFYPLGSPDSARVILGSERATNEVGSLGSEVDYVSRSVSVELPGGTNAQIGSVLLPVELPEDLLDRDQDEVLLADVGSVVERHGFAGDGASNFCNRMDNPSTVVAGYEYTDDPLFVVIALYVDVSDKKVSRTDMRVTVFGEGTRVLTDDIGDFNQAQCPAVDEANSVWG